jgi:nitrous oxide reductase accessory protein NosL
MRTLLTASCLATTVLLAACGPSSKPAEAPPPSTPAKSEPKCPDPRIKDPNNPCSPLYYKPVKGSFKGQKSF